MTLFRHFQRKKYWVLGMVLIASIPCFSHAKSLQVAAGWARPPYIDPQNHTGFELDLIRQVLSTMGYSTKVVYVPHKTTIDMLARGNVDMAITLNQGSGIPKEQLSDVYITYQNVVVSLKSRNLSINSIDDLSDRSLIGFQSAKDVLGDDFRRVTKDSPLYFEMADQAKQVELLLQGGTDLVILDVNVFNYLHAKLSEGKALQAIRFHRLFAPNPFRAGFKDLVHKHQFNQALQEFISSEQYQTLRQQYKIQTF